MGTTARTSRGLTGATLTLGLSLSLALTGCSGDATKHPPPTHSQASDLTTDPPGLRPDTESVAVPLKHYASCDEALATLRLAQAAVNAARRTSNGADPSQGRERYGSLAPGNTAAPGNAPAAAAPAPGANPGADSAPGSAPGSAPNVAPNAAPNAGANPEAKPGSSQSASPDHSTTNTAEPGVDEPDTVKTDGKAIVSVSRGTVYIVSTSDKRILGSVPLPSTIAIGPDGGSTDSSGNTSSSGNTGSSGKTGSSGSSGSTGSPGNTGTGSSTTTSSRPYYPGVDGTDQLLMAGDRVLAISRTPAGPAYPAADGDVIVPGARPVTAAQTRFTLIDTSDPTRPKVVSTLRLTGDFVDARMMGTTVRAITRTNPVVPETGSGTGWLPGYELQSHIGGAGGAQSITDGTVDCAAISHPDVYSGTSLLSLTTFDLGAAANRYSLGTGSPVSVVADGDTVYATGSSLYIANDLHAWQAVPLIRPGLQLEGSTAVAPADPYLPPTSRTEVYKFDVSGSGAPRPVASGSVPGWLLNQYSLSEYQGNLRIATTSGSYQDHADLSSSSAVYVLAPRGDALARIGAVTGLGQGEKIYSVRFAGPIGYVVTFRQMDPLYVVDLRDPAHPKTAGQLELTGYSSYLHPVDDKTLIGLGQAATTAGRRLGTQVSLFDVSDPSAPRLTARYELPAAYSGAEGDPHAFLYWKPTGMLVVPVSQSSDGLDGSASGALVLRVADGRIAEEGVVKHAGRTGDATFGSIPSVEQITRSLVANDTLWTVSGAGLLASNGLTLEDMGWIPYP
ncbi:hypothetical protein GCM10009839_75470 [Catenulispora yoronensis]|uniref:Beta propeller domain-containing protein n=1 Tax=Catenulispora yoronensis TaxID=450799 RepID=A0ABP5GVY6_9ACTN